MCGTKEKIEREHSAFLEKTDACLAFAHTHARTHAHLPTLSQSIDQAQSGIADARNSRPARAGTPPIL